MAGSISPNQKARLIARRIELRHGKYTEPGARPPRRPLLIAIDGRCASGKSTLAQLLKQVLEARHPGLCVGVFHMDDFYLRPEQRTARRYAEPGGNVDRERFFKEVLRPILRNRAFSYRPFDCTAFALGEPVQVQPMDIAIIEGSYSCHPALRRRYDLRIFMSVPKKTQLKRILARNGPEKLKTFVSKWIPLEERYFDLCRVRRCCDILLDG